MGGTVTGFVSGGELTGSFNGAKKGAFFGPVYAGIGAYYVDASTKGRVSANSLSGGVTSKATGDNFADGLHLGLATSMMRLGWKKCV